MLDQLLKDRLKKYSIIMNDLNHETLFKTPGEGHPFISWRHKKKLDIDFILLLTLFSTHTHTHTHKTSYHPMKKYRQRKVIEILWWLMKLKKIKIYKKILEKIYHCFQNQTEIYVWSDYVNGKLVINPTSKNHKIENAKKKNLSWIVVKLGTTLLVRYGFPL